MIFKQHKILFQILFAMTILFVLLMAISFWNGYMKNSVSPKIWPFIYLFFALASLIYWFLFQKKVADDKLIEEEINRKVEEERIKLLDELNKNKEDKEIIADKEEEIHTLINNILPKGKFQSSESYVRKLLSNLAQELEVWQGIFYIADSKKKNFNFLSGYAITSEKPIPGFALGENLNGQAAQTQELMVIDEIPENYFNVESGLGKSIPKSLLLMPIVDKKKTIGLIELAIFIEVQEKHKKIMSAMNKPVAEKLVQIQKL
ncbi:MAG: GAF domain-containing protein [Bacteroidales bacterium]|nr:GAF domain-containing protein [Bacteroidales bacterium]